jgi:uncharacterized protein YjbI with pentapeptide repeats
MASMGRCKYYQVCEIEDTNLPDNDLCILHSTDKHKSRISFAKALDAHRQRKRGSLNFGRMVFPEFMDFSQTKFSDRADFSRTTFSNGANFNGTIFAKGAIFTLSEFSEDASFQQTTFMEIAWFNKTLFSANTTFWESQFTRAHFTGTKFKGNIEFCGSNFSGIARFGQAEFRAETNFSDTTFAEIVFFPNLIFSEAVLFERTKFLDGVIFNGVIFKKKGDFSNAVFRAECEFLGVDFADDAIFIGANFLGRTVFAGQNGEAVFLGNASFERVVSTEVALRFIQIDLNRCRFIGTDVRKFQFVGVRWPRIGSRYGIYDETVSEPSQWSQIEELYRQLKQNYEDRHDYERAGDFHIGEKEMRLRNPETRLDLRIVLLIYKFLSEYGENYRRPLVWLILLWLLTSLTVLYIGLAMKSENSVIVLSPISQSDFGWALLYGFQTIIHITGKEFMPQGFAWMIHMSASILGPILIALAGFALRQRLKR